MVVVVVDVVVDVVVLVVVVVVMVLVVVLVVCLQCHLASDKPTPTHLTTVRVCLKVLISGAELSDFSCLTEDFAEITKRLTTSIYIYIYIYVYTVVHDFTLIDAGFKFIFLS